MGTPRSKNDPSPQESQGGPPEAEGQSWKHWGLMLLCCLAMLLLLLLLLLGVWTIR